MMEGGFKPIKKHCKVWWNQRLLSFGWLKCQIKRNQTRNSKNQYNIDECGEINVNVIKAYVRNSFLYPFQFVIFSIKLF